MTPARFRWGILLILIGVLILFENFDRLGHGFWIDFIIYFPFLLIAVGIEKIFTGSRIEFVSYLTSLALVAGTAYLVLDVNNGRGEESFFSKSTFTKEFDPAVENLQAELRLGDGSLTIRDAGDDMVYARFREFTRKPDVTYMVDDGTAKIEFAGRASRFFGGTVGIDTDEEDEWYVSFSRQVPLYLKCSGDRSDMHLNLSTTPLRQLDLEADDAEVYLKIGDLLPVVTVSVAGDASTLRLRVPNDVGLKISGMEDGSLLTRLGLVKEGGFFVTDGYDTLQNRITVDLDDRFRSLSIDFY